MCHISSAGLECDRAVVLLSDSRCAAVLHVEVVCAGCAVCAGCCPPCMGVRLLLQLLRLCTIFLAGALFSGGSCVGCLFGDWVETCACCLQFPGVFDGGASGTGLAYCGTHKRDPAAVGMSVCRVHMLRRVSCSGIRPLMLLLCCFLPSLGRGLLLLPAGRTAGRLWATGSAKTATAALAVVAAALLPHDSMHVYVHVHVPWCLCGVSVKPVATGLLHSHMSANHSSNSAVPAQTAWSGNRQQCALRATHCWPAFCLDT
jgi:hypothetical protein